MTDPNIRRWLNWSSEKYISELHIKTRRNTLSLRHLWINTIAKDQDEQLFMDVSLHHLGVKIGLIDNWKLLEPALRNIMAT